MVQHSAGRRAMRRQKNSLRQWIIFIVVAAVLSGVSYVSWGFLENKGLRSLVPRTVSDRTMSVGVFNSPESLDIRTVQGSSIEQVLLHNVYETLTTRGDDNTAQPGLSTSWKAENGMRHYTFSLRHGVTFADGTPLRAKDVLWSIQQLVTQRYVGAQVFDGLEAVNSPDDYTVTFDFKTPKPDLPWQLSTRAGAVLNKKLASEKDAMRTKAIGSGPFVVQQFAQGSPIMLVRNDNYYGPKALLRQVNFQYFNDMKSAQQALTEGAVQAVVPVTPAAANELTAITRNGHHPFVKHVGKSASAIVLAFNNDVHSYFSDVLLRQTLRHFLNHDAILKALGGDNAPLYGPITSLDPGYEDLSQSIPAGDENKFAWIGARHMRYTLAYPSEFGAQVGQELSNQFKSHGLNVNVVMLSPSEWQDRVVQKHQFDMTITKVNASHNLGIYNDIHQIWGYENPDATQALDKVHNATSQADYEKALRDAARIINTGSPVDWLAEYRPITVTSEVVKDFPMNFVTTDLPMVNVSLAD